MNFHMSLNLGWGMWWDKCFISFQFILLVCWGEGEGTIPCYQTTSAPGHE